MGEHPISCCCRLLTAAKIVTWIILAFTALCLAAALGGVVKYEGHLRIIYLVMLVLFLSNFISCIILLIGLRKQICCYHIQFLTIWSIVLSFALIELIALAVDEEDTKYEHFALPIVILATGIYACLRTGALVIAWTMLVFAVIGLIFGTVNVGGPGGGNSILPLVSNIIILITTILLLIGIYQEKRILFVPFLIAQIIVIFLIFALIVYLIVKQPEGWVVIVLSSIINLLFSIYAWAVIYVFYKKMG